MRVALFIPCYMDQLFPDAARACLELLEKHGLEVVFPEGQTCCGQPMANSGCVEDAKPAARHFIDTFSGYDHIVCPSGSCTSMVRHHYGDLVENREVPVRIFELCEFLHDVLKVESLDASFPHRIGLHQACHGLRELRLASGSERQVDAFNKPRDLLRMVKDVELVELARPDECCGFGGTFSVNEEAVSVVMGNDRVADHERAGAEFIVSTDLSCLMHMDGLIRRQGKKLRTLHIAQVLNGSAP